MGGRIDRGAMAGVDEAIMGVDNGRGRSGWRGGMLLKPVSGPLPLP